MSNPALLQQFFHNVDLVIDEMSEGDSAHRELLRQFFFRVLSIIDGVEGADVTQWRGIALIAKEDLKSGLEEINDNFLHELWSERHN
jgi:hypothetical protein